MSKKIVRSPAALARSTGLVLAPEPCDAALTLARAELIAVREQAEDTAIRLLDGLADVKSMSAVEILTAVRVAKVRLDALQTIALAAIVLE